MHYHEPLETNDDDFIWYVMLLIWETTKTYKRSKTLNIIFKMKYNSCSEQTVSIKKYTIQKEKKILPSFNIL